MEINIVEIGKKVFAKDMVISFIRIKMNMMDNGIKIKSMVKAYLKKLMVIYTRANGLRIK